MLDSKVTKRHFPKCNNNDLLEFVFEKDPNRYLRKNSIIIQGAIEVDEKYIVENGCPNSSQSSKSKSIVN